MKQIEARIIADSINPVDCRLTAFVLTYPKFIHAEFMTHRVFSRNSASSRAIPVKKMLWDVFENPVVPVRFGSNKSGMQAGEELPPWSAWFCRQIWLLARLPALLAAILLLRIGLHKQWVNRIVEPWMWITLVVSATDWKNFFQLRCHKDAQPEIQVLADAMLKAYVESEPKRLAAGEWHLPFADRFTPKEYTLGQKIIVSTARCARTSYMNYDGDFDYSKDEELYKRLVGGEPIHASPSEHPAEALNTSERVGNFCGWKQHRKFLPNECGEGVDLGELYASRGLGKSV